MLYHNLSRRLDTVPTTLVLYQVGCCCMWLYIGYRVHSDVPAYYHYYVYGVFLTPFGFSKNMRNLRLNTYYTQTYMWTFKDTYFCSRAGGRLLYGPQPRGLGAAGVR